MKRILFLATANIWERNGGGLAMLAYLNALKVLFPGKVDLAVAEEYVPTAWDRKDIVVIPPRSRRAAFFSTLAGHLHRNNLPIQEYLKKKQGEYSVLVINGGVYAGDMVQKIRRMGLKVIVIHHNYERDFHMDNKTIWTLGGWFPYLIVQNERKSYTNANANLFLTSHDMNTFHKVYGHTSASNHLLGVFECQDNEPKTVVPASSSNIVSVSGSLNHYQATSGIIDLCDNYLQLMLKRIPNLKIILTGRNPSSEILRLVAKYDGVFEIIANPEDVSTVVSLGNIYLCPTNIGGGIKLRVMDALRIGMPILVHQVSARGYDAFYDKPYFKVYHDPLSFESALDDLLEYVKKGDIDKRAIQSDYLKEFSFAAGVERMKAILSEAF